MIKKIIHGPFKVLSDTDFLPFDNAHVCEIEQGALFIYRINPRRISIPLDLPNAELVLSYAAGQWKYVKRDGNSCSDDAVSQTSHSVSGAEGMSKLKCWCLTCVPIAEHSRMALCPDCGNKRCPKANDHRNACTGSNDLGQKGSPWEYVKAKLEANRPELADQKSQIV